MTIYYTVSNPIVDGPPVYRLNVRSHGDLTWVICRMLIRNTFEYAAEEGATLEIVEHK